MALAEAEDVATALGRDLTATEQARVEGLLGEASDLVIGYLRQEPDPVPDAVTRATAAIVASTFTKPAQILPGEGPYGVHYANGDNYSGSVWLTAALRTRLRPYRIAMISMPVTSEVGA